MSTHEGKPAVLVVEDEPLVRMTAVDAVAEVGAKALEAQDASSALEILNNHPEVRVLFTDVNMPGEMNGLQLAEVVHRTHPRIELVVTSGKVMLQEASLPGTGTFLQKPYSIGRLVVLLKEKLSGGSRR